MQSILADSIGPVFGLPPRLSRGLASVAHTEATRGNPTGRPTGPRQVYKSASPTQPGTNLEPTDLTTAGTTIIWHTRTGHDRLTPAVRKQWWAGQSTAPT